MFNVLLSEPLFDHYIDIYMLILLAVVSAVLMVFVGYKLLQVLQLTGYKLKGYLHWFKETKYSYLFRLFILTFLSIASMLMTNVLLSDFFVVRPLYYVSSLFYILFCTIFIINLFSAKQKTPLKYTKRMTRLVLVYFIFAFALSLGLIFVGYLWIDHLSFALVGLVPVLLPLVVFAAYFVTYPIEKCIANSYIKKAKQKLLSIENIKVIGITGSYGKTSVKNILKTILAEKYKVCASPSSFNTPLGLSKTILNNLKPTDEIFIAEMGAKQRYDIKELCDIVKPSVGVITGVGSQHLSTFGSLENIILTKGELAEYIKSNGGKMFINIDSVGAKTLAKSYENATCISMEGGELFVKDIETSKDGLKFKLCYGKKSVDCQTVLLGSHNISNILVASYVALFEFNLSLNEISNGISKLVTTPHRLEIVRSSSRYTIIDDAYNSSVEGSKASLDVISKFDGQKFVITPGLVELGLEQFNANFEFGRNLAAVCDYVIIDSAINYDAISSGLIFAGFDEKKIIQVTNLNQAVSMLSGLAHPHDVVLFENDLPDNYS